VIRASANPSERPAFTTRGSIWEPMAPLCAVHVAQSDADLDGLRKLARIERLAGIPPDFALLEVRGEPVGNGAGQGFLSITGAFS
jgi:hypothetical protein